MCTESMGQCYQIDIRNLQITEDNFLCKKANNIFFVFLQSYKNCSKIVQKYVFNFDNIGLIMHKAEVL